MKRATDTELRCNPRIAYDRMLPPGVYSLSISYHFFIIQIPLNRSTAVSEKISFLGSAKKRWQTDKFFCNFWLCVGSCELQMCLAVWADYSLSSDFKSIEEFVLLTLPEKTPL